MIFDTISCFVTCSEYSEILSVHALLLFIVFTSQTFSALLIFTVFLVLLVDL